MHRLFGHVNAVLQEKHSGTRTHMCTIWRLSACVLGISTAIQSELSTTHISCQMVTACACSRLRSRIRVSSTRLSSVCRTRRGRCVSTVSQSCTRLHGMHLPIPLSTARNNMEAAVALQCHADDLDHGRKVIGYYPQDRSEIAADDLPWNVAPKL